MLIQPPKYWHKCATSLFWSEVAPKDHLVQIYENDEVLLDSLVGFVDSGLNEGESIITIASADHLTALHNRLFFLNHDINQLINSGRYIPLDAEETLATFMVNGLPDETRFLETMRKLFTQAKGKSKRSFRAYGEMVALLWSKGMEEATHHLESLWTKLCAEEKFCLFCSYPKNIFKSDANISVNNICAAHTKLIAGDVRSISSVYYQSAHHN